MDAAMRSSASLSSHPIHPMLVGFPIAYLIGSAGLDLLARVARRTDWYRTSQHMTKLGLASALLAAAPGLVDYVFAVPPRSSAKRRATDHMFANVSALALFALANAGRRARDGRPAPWALAAELGGAALMGAAGWMGGTLAYRNQIGVDHRYADAGRWRVEPRAPADGDGVIDAGWADLGVGQMKLVRAGSRRILIGRVEDGYCAVADRCTHRGGSLTDGTLTCGVVQCPWHGSQFDLRDGTVRHGPASEPIATYAVWEREGRLTLDLTGRAAPRRRAASRP
jgi:nitrite reductase/ring-hydroxylating ferredoxin subunit/uncharacterized membrane protein